MRIQPQVLGYFILPHDGSEGFASLSLEELLELHGNKLKFPFLNPDRLQRLKCHPGVQERTIRYIDSTGCKYKIGWSPTSRFLYQMSQSATLDKLGVPSNGFIITTNRKVIIEIIKFGQPNNSSDLTLKTKLKLQPYGKEIKMAYVNQVQYDFFWNRKISNNLLGLKFGQYLTTEDNKIMKIDATLFSIHCLQIDDVCFIYEAEIDAIQYLKYDNGTNGAVSIIEIKLASQRQREEIRKSFNQYSEWSKMKASSRDRIKSPSNNFEDIYLGPNNYGLPFRQGELGNVQKFLFGFYDKRNQSAKSSFSAEEFDCYPGTFLTRDASYLHDFVQLLNGSRILSPSCELTWDDWDSWKLTKDQNSVKLEKDGDVVGNLTK